VRRRTAFFALFLALLLGGGTVTYFAITGETGRDEARSARSDRTAGEAENGAAAESSALGASAAGSAEEDALAGAGTGEPAASTSDADPDAAEPPAEPDPAYAISGAVVDATGREVAGATVELFRHGSDPAARGAFEELIQGLDSLAEELPIASVRTDLAGRFSLVAGAPGEYRVGATLAPFAGAVEGPFRLTERDPAVELLVVLGGGLAITGHVENDAGAPIAGAEVALLDQLEGELPGQHYHAHRTTSAADGSFRFEGVESRRYILIAVADGYARALIPAVAAPLDGLRVQLGRGRELLVRVLAAAPEDGSDSEGESFLAAGTPIAGAEVYAVNPIGIATAMTDEDGLARLVIAGQDVSLRVMADGYETGAAGSVAIPLDPAEGPHDVLLTPRASFAGVVVRSDGSRAPFAEIIELGSALLGGGLRTTRADAEGRFSAENRSVIAALDGEVSDLGLVLPETIALVPTITVTGRLLDPAGRPAVGARVRLELDLSIGNRGESLLRAAGAETAASAGADGRFSLAGVPMWGSIYLRIECEGCRDRTVPLAEDLGEVLLGEEAVLEGRILTPEGRPPSAAALILELPGAAPLRRDAATGALRGGVRVLVAGDGSFRIDRLDPEESPLELHVVAPPYLEEQQRVPLSPGANGPIEIRLREGGEAIVRVIEGSGTPFAAARVELQPSGGGATRSGRTGADGVARFPGIAAGSYTVRAISGVNAGAALLEVRAGEIAELELPLE